METTHAGKARTAPGALATPAASAGQFIPLVCRACSRVRHVSAIEFHAGGKNACTHCGTVTDLALLAHGLPRQTPPSPDRSARPRRVSEFP